MKIEILSSGTARKMRQLTKVQTNFAQLYDYSYNQQPYEHRVIYVASYATAIYILHCFPKKTQRTPLNEIQIARSEYAELQKLQQKTDIPKADKPNSS